MSKTVLQKNVNIPVHMTDISTFDDSFSYMKERFQAEMRRVSEEMNKFSSDLMRLYASPFVNNAIASRANSSVTTQQKTSVTSHQKAQKKGKEGGKTQSNTTSYNASTVSSARANSQHSAATTRQNLSATTHPPDIQEASETPALTTEESLASDHANWSAITESPLILVEGENKKLKLQFDVSQFDPAEVKVQILNDVLHVKAKHDERTDNTLVLREYSRQFMLPKGIDPEAVVSSLSRDGVLTVEAPLPQLVIELGKELEKIKAEKK